MHLELANPNREITRHALSLNLETTVLGTITKQVTRKTQIVCYMNWHDIPKGGLSRVEVTTTLPPLL